MIELTESNSLQVQQTKFESKTLLICCYAIVR